MSATGMKKLIIRVALVSVVKLQYRCNIGRRWNMGGRRSSSGEPEDNLGGRPKQSASPVVGRAQDACQTRSAVLVGRFRASDETSFMRATCWLVILHRQGFLMPALLS